MYIVVFTYSNGYSGLYPIFGQMEAIFDGKPFENHLTGGQEQEKPNKSIEVDP